MAVQKIEHVLLTNRRRDVVVAASLVAATTVVFVLVAMADPGGAIQARDDAFLRTMRSLRSNYLTGIARTFDVLGRVWVTVPARVFIIGYLAVKRRWWHLGAFAGAIVLSEFFIGPMKMLYARPRPPGALVATSGFSFPSGHAIAASVTAVAAVIAFVPTGRARAVWGVFAALFTFLMGLSRAYLGAHWLTDVVAGTLLGTSVAVVSALALQLIWDRSGEPMLPDPEEEDPD